MSPLTKILESPYVWFKIFTRQLSTSPKNVTDMLYSMLFRRTFCNQVLQIIKDEGAFSTMHTLLVYLQMAPMEQQPAVATLLLQLDLLVGLINS